MPKIKTDPFTLLVVTFFGSGLSPKAPGTAGSILATLLAYPIALVSFSGCFFIAALLVFFLALPFVVKAMRDTKTEDPGWIVIDEVAGQWMTFTFIAPEVLIARPWLLLLGLAFFRFFDILKPLGIKKLEKIPGAWGVMLDDLLGGIYAGVMLWAVVCGL
ncbi:MAG: phosphatidylglycerophosphatase A [Fibrobacter sp.]|jgi:phosphatidylglycerophosphatase A|nr:phosphatidylglycerophosphatase A [Fibrobacter sp.]